MKAKNKLLLLALYTAVLLGFASMDSLAVPISSFASGNWNAGGTWVGGVVPSNLDDVTIVNGHTVVVNLDLTNANTQRSVQSLTIQNGATLRPDAGVRNIEIDNDLTVAGTGVAQYNYLTTGRLNWVFTGVTDGSGSISSAELANTQFHNLSFAGTGVTGSSSGANGFIVYGNLDISALSSLDMDTDLITFTNTTAKTITNNNTLTLASISLTSGSTVTYNSASGADNNLEGDITVATTATLNIASPTVLDATTSTTHTIANSGSLNFNSGSEFNIEALSSLSITGSTGDINNFNGALTFAGTGSFIMGARSINGTGSITTAGLTTISLANAQGVKGAINLTGTRTFNASTSYTFTGASDTGFNYTTGNDVTSLGTLTVSGVTTSADSFTVTTSVAGASAFTASTGTITVAGTTTTIIGGGAKTFNNLTVTSSTTATLSQSIAVGGSLIQTGAGSFVTGANTVAMTGTGTLTLLSADFTGPGAITVSGASSNVTLGAALNLGAVGTLTLNNTTATLDLATFAIAGAAIPHSTLTAGNVRTSSTTGLVGNFSTGYAAGELSVTAAVSYDFYGAGAGKNLGFDIGNVTGGAATGILDINNLTITSGDYTGAGKIFSAAGNITVASGASLITAFAVTMNGTTAQTITNSAATSAALTFTGLTIGNGATAGVASVTTASNFTMAGSLTMTGVDAASLTATAGTITFGAGSTQTFAAAGGVLTLFNATVTTAQTWAAGQSTPGDFRIDGNLLVTIGAFVVTAAQDITFRGYNKTIEVTGGSMALGDVNVTGTYTTVSPFTVAGDVFANTGSFNASTPSAITFSAGPLSLTNTTGGTAIDSLVFYDVIFAANTNTGTEIFTVSRNFNTTGAFNGTAGNIMFMGEPSLATVTAGTIFGNVNIPVGKTLQFVSGTSALANTMTLNGTLSVNLAAQLAGAGLIAYGNNSNLILNGPVATGVVGAITASGVHTFTGSARVNLEIGTLANNITTLGLGGVTGGLNANINNLTLGHSGTAIADLGAAVTMYGNFTKTIGAGTVALTDGATNAITFAGTTKTFTNLAIAANLTFDDVTISGSYSELASSNGFGVGLAAGSASSFTVNTASSWTSALATIAVMNLNSTTPASLVVTGTGTAVFNNFTVGANSTSNAITSSYTVNGNYTKTALGTFQHTAASTVTLSGTSKTLINDATGADNRDLLTFINLTVSGTYSTPLTSSGFNVGTSGILTVTGTGSLLVQSGLITVPGTTEGVSFAPGSYITGTGTITLGALTVTGGVVQIASGTTVTIDGDVAGALTITAGSLTGFGTSTVVLDNGAGTNNITNGGTITFANLSVGANAVVTNNTNFTVKKDLTVGSGASFVSSTPSVITLDSALASSTTISNAGTLTFFDLTLGSTAAKTITTATGFNVANNMIVGALVTFTASAGTVTFNGGTQSLTNNNSTSTGLTFFGLSKTGTLILSTITDNGFQVKSDLTASGTTGQINFQSLATNGRLMLNGTSEQNIVIGTTIINKIQLGFVTLNNTFGAKLNNATTEGDVIVYRTLRLQNGELDLNGNNIIQLDATNGLLSETVGNTISNSGVSTSVGYVFVDKTSATFSSNNMNGIGVTMTTAAASTMKVRRFHIPRTVGAVDGIFRVFGITSGTTTGLDAKAVFRYDENELNGLVEANLNVARTNNQISGNWFLEPTTVNTTNNILTVDNINGFGTGTNYEYWTASIPVVVTTIENTKGLAVSPLVAGRQKQAIYGLNFSANGTVDVNSVKFTLNRDITLANEFTNYFLVRSTDDNYSTTDDNTTLISGTNGSPATIAVSATGVTFTVSGLTTAQQLSQGSSVNYFLAVDISTSTSSATAAVQPSFTEPNISVTNGIVKSVTETGTSYTFKAGIMVDKISNGLTASPLIANTTNNALLGFQMTTTSAIADGFDTLFVSTNSDVTSKFSAVRLVRSTTNDITTGTLTTVKTGVISSTGITFNNLNEAGTTAAKFYFVVADVLGGVDRNTSTVILTIADDDLNDDANAGPRFVNALGDVSSSFSSSTYTFDKSTVTISQTTPLVTQNTNLGRGLNSQPIYRFTLTSDNSNPITLTEATVHATLGGSLSASAIASWRLWNDANNNDYPDAGEQIAVGVYTAANSQGNLKFSSFTTPQTFSSSRKYIVTANITSAATVNGTIALNIISQSYLKVNSPAKVNSFANSTGSTYTVKAPGVATTAKIVGLSTNNTTSGSNVSFTVQSFDASNVPAAVTSATTVTLNVAAGGYTFGGTPTGTILGGSSFLSITPTVNHTTGTTLATATATLTGGLSVTTVASPTFTIFKTAPTTNGVVTLGTVTSSSILISSWTSGTGGTGRLVVVSANTPPVAPVNGTTYTANSNIGSGVSTVQTGAGSFVVAIGNSAATTVTGLTPGVTYYVQTFEYDGSGSTIVYNRTHKTSVAASGTPGNPAFKSTSTGTVGALTLLTAANISTDVDVNSNITTISEATDGKWFKFKINSNRNNFYIRLNTLPKNYQIYLYNNTTGTDVLFRTSEIASTGNEVVIVNNATAGEYLIKVFGSDNEQYSSSNFGIKVVTSANKILTLTE